MDGSICYQPNVAFLSLFNLLSILITFTRCCIDDIQEHNLYPYPRRHPNEPIIEILKPVTQVIEEDRAANKFRVGGRHSSYFGSQ